jgi:exopolysaccharide production protein ExoQ
MADSSFLRRLDIARPSHGSDWVAQTAFGAFLYLVFVGLTPFALQNLSEEMAPNPEGDLARQICYIACFVVIVGLAFAYRRQMVLKAVPIPLAFVLVWCLTSVGWSVNSGISLRRLILGVIIVTCVMCGVDTLGTQRTLRVLRFVLATIIIADCVSLLLVPQAVHLPDELEAELAGNWRGMHGHKNIAGPIAALSGMLFLHFALVTRRWRDWLLFVAASAFLAGTFSKTAIGFYVMSIVIAMIYRKMCRTETGRQLFRYVFAALLVFAAVGWMFAYETITDLLSDPTGFTGRVAIWQTVFDYLRDHWLLGAGFGTFWQVGDESPAQVVNPANWIPLVPHSHNGYLEILATTGVVGMFLCSIAFIANPVKQLLDSRIRDVELQSLMLALFIFIVFSNLLETVFLNRGRPEWVIFLIVLALLHQSHAGGASVTPSLVWKRPWRKDFPHSSS